jgi:hypothetical protein
MADHEKHLAISKWQQKWRHFIHDVVNDVTLTQGAPLVG